MQFDVLIVGGGPVGLSFAVTLAQWGRIVAVIEQSPAETLRAPSFDGREIALTKASVKILKEIGAWDLFRPEDISPLRSAMVLNGAGREGLALLAPDSSGSDLAYLVSNQLIRESLFRVASSQEGVTLFCGGRLEEFTANATGVTAHLRNGEVLTASLLVAADSRFSAVRGRLGIAAELSPVGRSMVVFRVAHAIAHHQTATEWFGHDRTMAFLPLNGGRSSIVLTLSPTEAERIMGLSDEALAAQVMRWSGGRLGETHVTSSRHLYPLMLSYAKRFVGPRAALIGDAAVGMHPVTAHGFNFGLQGQQTLARNIDRAARAGEDIGAPAVLLPFERQHQRATRPLYLATNALVRLYTNESTPGRLARHAMLGVARGAPFVRQAIAAVLAG